MKQATRDKLNKRRREEGTGTKSYRSTRAKKLELLGGKCVRCSATENLEINHRNQADTLSYRRSGDRCYIKLKDIEEGVADVEILCAECHKRWSIAQRKAAIELFSQLSVEEQIKLAEEHF